MDRTDYEPKLSLIVEDTTNYSEIDEDFTETQKKRLTNLIDASKLSTNGLKLSKLVGPYKPGYLYDNSETHQSETDPPLRPIISQISTSSYDHAKTLNDILKKYVPDKYCKAPQVNSWKKSNQSQQQV